MLSLKALLPVTALLSLTSAVDIRISGKSEVVFNGLNHTEFTVFRKENDVETEVCKGVSDTIGGSADCPTTGGKLTWFADMFQPFTVHYEEAPALV